MTTIPTPLSVEAQLAVISTKLDQLLKQRTEDREGHADHEARIRGLETYKSRLIGACAVLAVIGGSVAGAIASRV